MSLLNLQDERKPAKGLSQWGEDEMVLSLQSVLKPISEWLTVEFGGSTGPDNSNFGLLVENGAQGVFIEGDGSRFNKLKKYYSESDLAITLNEWVSPVESGPNSLKSICERAGFNLGNVTALSIDVDGDDYWHFEAIEEKIPIVVVEYNPTLPFGARFINSRGSNFGSSALSILELAQEKGYFLGGVTPTNLILLLRDTFGDVVVEQNLPDLERTIGGQVRFGLAYDGTVLRFSPSGKNLTNEVMDLGWSGGILPQPIPRYLRTGKVAAYSPKIIRRAISVLSLLSPNLLALLYVVKNSKGSRSSKRGS